MVGSALLSALHLLALAIGLPAVYARGRALRALESEPARVGPVLWADNWWGVAALLWLATGLARAFGGFEKGTAYYVRSGSFWVKMGLFGLVLLLELWPMVTFIRWRIAQGRGAAVDTSGARALSRVNTAEVGLTALLPFVAALMARGVGFGWFGE